MLKILFVEDDKTIVTNLTEYLNGAGYIVRSMSGQTAVALSLLFMLVFCISTYKRYQRISSLADDINQVLHGDSSIDFDNYSEGELSILHSEIYKMTIRLREQQQRAGLRSVRPDLRGGVGRFRRHDARCASGAAFLRAECHRRYLYQETVFAGRYLPRICHGKRLTKLPASALWISFTKVGYSKLYSLKISLLCKDFDLLRN